MPTRAFYRWTRDLHLYLGLFISPFVLVYAVSAALLVHAALPWGGRAAAPAERRSMRVPVAHTADGLAAAKEIRAALAIPGEIGYVSRSPEKRTLDFPIESPGRVASVHVELATGLATVEERETGVWDAMIYLHKMPGPHNAKIRGNWLFTRLWGWLVDATVYLLLFLSASGIYLWLTLRSERRAGLIFLGAGVASFTAIVVAIVA